jgi:cell division protein ZipA
MQPAVLDNPQVVFDDFVETVKLMTIELDGEALDHERKPLTDATIQLIRRSL